MNTKFDYWHKWHDDAGIALEEGGDLKFQAFQAGWEARMEHARTELGRHGNVRAADVLIQNFNDVLETYGRHVSHDLDHWQRDWFQDKRIRALEDQVRELSGDPNECFAYRRISEQRRQLREKDRIIAELKGER